MLKKILVLGMFLGGCATTTYPSIRTLEVFVNDQPHSGRAECFTFDNCQRRAEAFCGSKIVVIERDRKSRVRWERIKAYPPGFPYYQWEKEEYLFFTMRFVCVHSTQNDSIVALDERNGIRVITVFLGYRLDHDCGTGPPLLFETVVFEGEDNWEKKYVQRYSTREEAEEGHRQMCEKVFGERKEDG